MTDQIWLLGEAVVARALATTLPKTGLDNDVLEWKPFAAPLHVISQVQRRHPTTRRALVSIAIGLCKELVELDKSPP